MIEAGARVKWTDHRKAWFGRVVRFGRSSRNPWSVYFVQPETGQGNQIVLTAPIPELDLHAGESIVVVEVHGDRLERV